MNKIAVLVFVFVLLGISVSADIPPPPIGEQIRVETRQNYPDYEFYLCSYDLKVVPNSHPPHVSRPNMVVTVPDTFKIRQIAVSVEKPFTEAVTTARIQNRGTLVGKNLWLVAVKKSIGGANIEAKIKTAIDNKTNGDGIYTTELSQTLESKNDERIGAKVVVNTITKLDEANLEIQVSEGTVSAMSNKTISCVGLGLFLSGMIAFAGIWWTKKRIIK